jgi:hypothetical protein
LDSLPKPSNFILDLGAGALSSALRYSWGMPPSSSPPPTTRSVRLLAAYRRERIVRMSSNGM